MAKVKIKKRVAPLTLQDKIKKVLANYFSTQFVIMIIVGVATWGILTLLHIKYPIILGVLTGVLSGVPNFGMFIAIIAIFFVAIFDKVVFLPNTAPIVEGLVVLVIFVLLNKIVDLLVTPIFMGAATKINPIVMFVVIIVGTAFLGPIGAVLAVPLYLVVKTIVTHFSER